MMKIENSTSIRRSHWSLLADWISVAGCTPLSLLVVGERCTDPWSWLFRGCQGIHWQDYHVCKARPKEFTNCTWPGHTFQTQKCNRYCLKSYRRNEQFYSKCRFGIPRALRATTELNDVIDCLAVNQTKQPRKRLYNLTKDGGGNTDKRLQSCTAAG